MKKSISILFVLFLTSCGGGGGGGGSSLPFYGGVWRGSLILVKDECGIASNNLINFTHTVNQDGRRVVLDSGNQAFAGDLDDDNNGFTVLQLIPPADGCQAAIGFVYEGSPNEQVDVGLVAIAQCPTVSCETVYLGGGDRD